jgi:glycosyltransferase involved in cell wall biosynthesis
MPDPIVSVVVTSWHDEDYIAKTLHGLLNQTFPKTTTEILIANDAAEDGTPALIRDWQKQYEPLYNKITFIQTSQRIGRPAPFRNEMIRHSQGRFIIPLDGDDYWQPQKIATQVATLSKHDDIAFCATGYEWINKDDQALQVNMSLPTNHYGLEDLLKKPVLITSAVAWDQEKTQTLYYPEDIKYQGWEDQKFYANWLSDQSNTVYFMNDIMMQYRVLPTSGSGHYPLHMRPIGTQENFLDLASPYQGDRLSLFQETETFLANRSNQWDVIYTQIKGPELVSPAQ